MKKFVFFNSSLEPVRFMLEMLNVSAPRHRRQEERVFEGKAEGLFSAMCSISRCPALSSLDTR